MPVILIQPPKTPYTKQLYPRFLPRFYTRLYLQSTTVAPVSPAFDAAWEETSNAVRRTMKTTKQSEAMTTLNITSVALAQDTLFYQGVSPALSGAQTFKGVVRAQIRTSEALATADAFSRLVLKVVSNDGSTVRGTMVAFTGAGSGTEWVASLTNNSFALLFQMTEVSALDGDRVVLELGCNHAAVATTISLSIGDDNATDLLDAEETQTSAFNPWLDIEGSYSFVSGRTSLRMMRGLGL